MNIASARDVARKYGQARGIRYLPGDKAFFDPDFRTLAPDTYRGFVSADPSLSLRTNDRTFTVLRDGQEVITRLIPVESDDGRASDS